MSSRTVITSSTSFPCLIALSRISASIVWLSGLSLQALVSDPVAVCRISNSSHSAFSDHITTVSFCKSRFCYDCRLCYSSIFFISFSSLFMISTHVVSSKHIVSSNHIGISAHIENLNRVVKS